MLAEDLGLPAAMATKVAKVMKKMAKVAELTLSRFGRAILSGTEQLQWEAPSPTSHSQISLTPTIVAKCKEQKLSGTFLIQSY